MNTIASATTPFRSLQQPTTPTQTLPIDHPLLQNEFRDGLSPADFHRQKAREAKALQLLELQKSKRKSSKNKENTPADPMAEIPSTEDLYVLGRPEPRSLRTIAMTEYHVHLGLIHSEADDESASATSTPPGSPSQVQAVIEEDDAANINLSERLFEEGVPIFEHSIFGGSSPLTSPPSSPSPIPRPANTYELDPAVFGGGSPLTTAPSSPHPYYGLAVHHNYDPSIFGRGSPLTTAPSSPSQSSRASDYESDSDIGVALFERLAARRRVLHRRRYIWSSDEDSDESDSEAPTQELARGGPFPSSSSPTASLAGLALSVATVVEGSEARGLQDAEAVLKEFSQVATTIASTRSESEQAAIRNAKGKSMAVEDLDDDNAELANALNSSCQAPITDKGGETHGHPNAVGGALPSALVVAAPSSPSTVPQTQTSQASVTAHPSCKSPGPSSRPDHRALSKSEPIESIADVLIGILMRSHQQWIFLDDILKTLRGLGHLWCDEDLAKATSSHDCVVRRAGRGGIYYRYEDSLDNDFDRHWRYSVGMEKELSALRRET